MLHYGTAGPLQPFASELVVHWDAALDVPKHADLLDPVVVLAELSAYDPARSLSAASSRWWPCGSTMDAFTSPSTSWKKTKSGCMDRQFPCGSRYAMVSESIAGRGGLRYQPKAPGRAISVSITVISHGFIPDDRKVAVAVGHQMPIPSGAAETSSVSGSTTA